MTGPTFDAEVLRADLVRRFRTITRSVDISARNVTLLSPANADDLISEDDYVADERLPYWADLWPSAQILADELAIMRLGGLRVLELGCGLGAVAIGATMGGAAVTATDYYADAIEFARLNVFDATARVIDIRMVDWSKLPPDLGKFDMVVASDVLYEPRYSTLVRDVLLRALAKGGEAIIADPGRIAAPDFLDLCSEAGLSSEPDVRKWTDGEITQTITLHHLHWRT